MNIYIHLKITSKIKLNNANGYQIKANLIVIHRIYLIQFLKKLMNYGNYYIIIKIGWINAKMINNN